VISSPWAESSLGLEVAWKLFFHILLRRSRRSRRREEEKKRKKKRKYREPKIPNGVQNCIILSVLKDGVEGVVQVVVRVGR